VLVVQGRRDSNPQPPVLETGALPVEPRPFGAGRAETGPKRPGAMSVPRGTCDDRGMSATHAAMGAQGAPNRGARRLSGRVGAIAESATLAVDAKAKALKAAGRDVIGFGAGEPDFPTPAHIVAAAEVACRDPKMHHYTPAAGLPELRAAIAAKTARDSGLHLGANQVLVTNGGKHAVHQAFATLLDPGDEVLLPAPYWTTYPEAIALAGGVSVPVLSTPERGYRVTTSQLEAACTARTKVLLFCSPSNPTGAVYSSEEVGAIGQWAVDNDMWVLTDEIYEHLVYGDAEFSSMPVQVPALAERCVVVNGVAKTYAMTGWRVGWLAGPADVVKAAINLQSHTTSNVSNVAQAAALAAVGGDLQAVGVRPASPADAPDAGRHPGGELPRAPWRLLLLPVGPGNPRPIGARADIAHFRAACRGGSRPGRGRRRPRGGVRNPRLFPAFLRHGR